VIALGEPEHAVSGPDRQRLLAAYLKPWHVAGYASGWLEAALARALRLGPLYHAVSYHPILSEGGQAARAELGPALGALLDAAISRHCE
jgi:hypothetical protein